MISEEKKIVIYAKGDIELGGKITYGASLTFILAASSTDACARLSLPFPIVKKRRICRDLLPFPFMFIRIGGT